MHDRRRAVARAARDDLHAALAAPRRRGHRPTRPASSRPAWCCRCPRPARTASASARAIAPRSASPSRPTRVAVVVSEETGSVSLVERGRIVRNLDEERLRRGLIDLLSTTHLAAARIPARATVLRRRGLPLRPRVRARRSAAIEAPVTAAAHCATAACHGPGSHSRTGSCEQHAGGDFKRPSRVRRVTDFLLRNWPLKLGAIILATVLYSGLVLGQNVRTWTGRCRSTPSARRPARRCSPISSPSP